MEGLTGNIYRNLKEFLTSKRGYQRLNVGGARRRRNRAKLGRAGDSSHRRQFWKIRILPRVQRISPKKFLVRLRDTYVNFMLGIASTPALAGSTGGFGYADNGVAGFGRITKEYDEKVIIEIYKSLVMAQEQLALRDTATYNSRIST